MNLVDGGKLSCLPFKSSKLRLNKFKTTGKIMTPLLTESIGMMIPNDNRLELPKTPIKNYAALKKVLTQAGGKYSKNGFTFSVPGEDIQNRLLGGEVLNDKKKFQQFFTSPELAQWIIAAADIWPGHNVLEPSAGHGALIDAMDLSETRSLTNRKRTNVLAIEIDPENCKVLKSKGYNVLQADFMEFSIEPLMFDRIVANPPFTKNQDIDHIKKMFTLLAPGGKLVSLAGTSWENGSYKKQAEFREWLAEHNGIYSRIPKGAFKASGTKIATTLIEMIKD